MEDGVVRWVWRPFRRGGLVGRVIRTRYLFLGEAAVRSFREWRLLSWMRSRGLPVPRPVAARYQRHGPWYSADLLVERIDGAETLSAMIATDLSDEIWRAVGSCIARFHGAGVFHADLNAHNILLAGDRTVYLIDFDRGSRRAPGRWREHNLARLQRSLNKLAAHTAQVERGYRLLLETYAAAG